MNKIFLIARHEFLSVVTRKSFVLSLILIPLLVGLVFVLLMFKTASEDAPVQAGRVGVIDGTGAIDLSLGFDREKHLSITKYDDLDKALDEIRNGRLDILYVVSSEYLQTGRIDVYSKTTRHLLGNSPTGFAALNKSLRAGLLQKLLPPDHSREALSSDPARQLLSPPSFNKLAVGVDGQVGPMRDTWERISAVLAPLSLVFLMAISVFLSSGYLLQATVEEKQNRVIEVLLSSVRTPQLIWGKVLGLGAVGLLQVAVYLLLVHQAALYLWAGFDLTMATLAGFFVYWMLGHLLYASLLVVTGILVGAERESNQFMAIWLFVLLAPVLLADTLLLAPNGVLARVLSYVPVTSPATMVFRLARTTVPTIEIVLSLTVLVVSIYLIVDGAAKIFRIASLMYGKRISLPEVMRWLREA